MILILNNILNRTDLATFQDALGPQAPWIAGESSAGGQAVTQKNNRQLAQDSDVAKTLQQRILQAVQSDPLFFSAALPLKLFNPLFNCYGGESNHYGPHIDGAILNSRHSGQRVRTDLSCTVFLNEPEDYDGGELTVHDTYGAKTIKLSAGSAVLYPGTSLHEVRPVTRGQRLASFFWVESMVRSDEQRRLLFDLDMNLLKLRQQHGETPECTALTGTYHNLLRMWANT
jgi:PKHD-type hydroxylase